MKSVKYVVMAALLGTISFASAAAQPLQAAPCFQTGAAAVNVSGSSSLISLEQQLSGKQESGRVTSFPHRFDLWREQAVWHSRQP